MDEIEVQGTKTVLTLLKRAEDSTEEPDAVEQLVASAVGAMNIVTLANHNKRDASRRAGDGGFLN